MGFKFYNVITLYFDTTQIIPSFSFALCNQIDQLKCYGSIVMLMREADHKWWQVSVVSHLVHADGNCWVQVNIGVEMILHPSSINTTNWFELNMSNYHRMMGSENESSLRNVSGRINDKIHSLTGLII